MKLVREGKSRQLRLRKELTRAVKRGHAWLFSDAVDPLPDVPSGTVAVLHDRRGEKPIACGIYDPEHAIPLRICRTHPPFRLDSAWAGQQLSRAAALRAQFFDERTTGYRLVAGEGDGLPGLIIDVYDRTAVIKLDGGAPQAFYQPDGIANWLQQELAVECVVLRSRLRDSKKVNRDSTCHASTPTAEILLGTRPTHPVPFLENGLRFYADVLQGQKTGFFLDQRDNRDLIRHISRSRRVLNLFSFNGGFSVAAGAGQAQHVTSVDIARPAIDDAAILWRENNLPESDHAGVVADCFEFLESAAAAKEKWDLVICDPPSFAPSEKVRDRALAAYGRLALLASKVTHRDGLLALASCSSHVNADAFTQVNAEALGRARRSATLLADCGLPLDHPSPLAMPELRYLKFQLYRLD